MLGFLLCLLAADTTVARPVTLGPGEVVNPIIAGSGPPVVLINGLVGGAFGFRTLIPPLAELGYRVVAVEPLGLGGSSRPGKADYSLTAQAERIARVLETLGVSHALMVAHSLGGSIALRLAYHRPDLVRGVLSIDGEPAETAAPPGLRRAMRWAPLLKLFVGRGILRREVRKGLLQNSSDTTWLTPEVLEGYTGPDGRDVGATINALRGMARSREPDVLRELLPLIRVPVWLLVGAVPHESALRPEEAELMQRLLPDFRLDRVAGAGQLVREEQPAAVLRALASLDTVAAPWPGSTGSR
jgi:pimeloyl-ACP methyl ester carboxylesterase